MEFKDYYKIIGVQRNATQDEIKRSYRKLARKYHPDVSKEADAEAHFKDVSEAYEVLRDPEKRLAYDQLGTAAPGARDFRPPPGWDQGFEFRDSGGDEAQAREFSEFFESLFARRGRASHAEQAAHAGQADWHAHGSDTHARVEIDLEASYQGATRSLVLKHTVMGADGRPRLAERTLDVAIPKGIRAGQQIRLARQGGPAIGRGEPGDLYLEVAFAPHPLYWPQGRDVTLELPVAPWELALGAKVTAPTPAGPVELTIPAHSAPGRRLRLKGRGIPGQPPGDFYVVLRVTLPADDSPAAQAAWRELADRLAFNPRANLGSATE